MMEVSGRTNGISFRETGERELDEVIWLKHSCRPLGRQKCGIWNEIYCP